MKEEKREEELRVVLCNYRICEYQHVRTNAASDNYKKNSSPTAQAEHGRRESEQRTGQ
jgi:hypothetical protein